MRGRRPAGGLGCGLFCVRPGQRLREPGQGRGGAAASPLPASPPAAGAPSSAGSVPARRGRAAALSGPGPPGRRGEGPGSRTPSRGRRPEWEAAQRWRRWPGWLTGSGLACGREGGGGQRPVWGGFWLLGRRKWWGEVMLRRGSRKKARARSVVVFSEVGRGRGRRGRLAISWDWRQSRLGI